MSREITTHRQAGRANLAVRIDAEEQAEGAAPWRYRLEPSGFAASAVLLDFAQGRYGGLTNEALLAVVMDRLEAFQAGAFAYEENGLALRHLNRAMEWLRRRAVRMEAGAPTPAPVRAERDSAAGYMEQTHEPT